MSSNNNGAQQLRILNQTTINDELLKTFIQEQLEQRALQMTERQKQLMGGAATSRGMSGLTTQRLNSTQRLVKKQPLRVDCTHCHNKQVEVTLYSSQLRDSEMGGNCEECGLFVLVDAGREKVISQAIRPLKKFEGNLTNSEMGNNDDQFKIDIPQNEILEKMTRRMQVGKIYNPAAQYVRNRKIMVDWMCNEAENLGYSSEAVHHSVAIYDYYYTLPNIEENQKRLIPSILQRANRDLDKLVGLISILISAKFLEMTYPGVERLNRILGSDSSYTYDDYIAMEMHVLHMLDWQLHLVTHYNLLSFFFSQGIVFTQDSIISYREQKQRPNAHTAKSAHGHAGLLLDMCLQEYAFMQYDPLILVCGIIMKARKMVKIQENLMCLILDKWPIELQKLTQRGKQSKELSQIKRCMLHISECYEDNFPQQDQPNLITLITTSQTYQTCGRQSTVSKSSSDEGGIMHSLSPQRWFKDDVQTIIDSKVQAVLTSEMTTPTDIETPAKQEEGLLLQAAKHFMSVTSQGTGQTLASTGEKQIVSQFAINESLKKHIRDSEETKEVQYPMKKNKSLSFLHNTTTHGRHSTNTTVVSINIPQSTKILAPQIMDAQLARYQSVRNLKGAAQQQSVERKHSIKLRKTAIEKPIPIKVSFNETLRRPTTTTSLPFSLRQTTVIQEKDKSQRRSLSKGKLNQTLTISKAPSFIKPVKPPTPQNMGNITTRGCAAVYKTKPAFVVGSSTNGLGTSRNTNKTTFSFTGAAKATSRNNQQVTSTSHKPVTTAGLTRQASARGIINMTRFQ